jgi:hypothetical protein
LRRLMLSRGPVGRLIENAHDLLFFWEFSDDLLHLSAAVKIVNSFSELRADAAYDTALAVSGN